MKYLSFSLFIMLFVSCIPLKIAPKIEDYKVLNAKKFKKRLPNTNAFIFHDSKDANEFYDYINIKYNLKHVDVEDNIPVEINGATYYFSFDEVRRDTKYINLLPFLIEASVDAALGGIDDYYETEVVREGTWYLSLRVTDQDVINTLDASHPANKNVLVFLKNLKQEYLTTSNYNELYFIK